MSDPFANEALQSLGRLKTARMNWESYWQKVAELVQPSFSNTFFGNMIVEGQQKDQKRFDGSAEIALYRFSAAMESMLTPRNSRWHGLATQDNALNMRPRVRLWFDAVTDALFKYRYAPQANFASQCHEHYQGLGFLGTAAMFIDRMSTPTMPAGLRYAQIPISNIYFDQNHQGITDRVYRPFKMKARNAVVKFAGGKLSDHILAAAKGANPDQFFDFVHCIEPNLERDPKRKDWRGMYYVSYYVDKESATVVMMEGYNSFPFAISRYMTAPGEMYGRSPAMQAFTNIRVLNEQKKTFLKQGQRVVDPVLLAHDDGVLDSFSLKPGAINPGAINARGQRLVDVLPTGNLALGDKMMEMEKAEIAAAFLTDLFQILVDGPQMTATEIIERAREKGALLSPTMGRQESEFLGPMIERELDLLMMQQLIPPMPPELIEARGEYKIIYDSPLARAQKAEQTAGIMRVVQWAAEVSQLTQNPAPLDHFNWDVIIPDLSLNQAVPGRYMATAEQLKAIRDGRQQQAAIEQVIKAGPAVASIAAQRTAASNQPQ